MGRASGRSTMVRSQPIPSLGSKDVHDGVSNLPRVKKQECKDRTSVVLGNALRSWMLINTLLIASMDMGVPNDRLVGEGGNTCTLPTCSRILHP